MREQIYEVFRKWLYMDDEEGIDCILANAIAALLPGDPLWMFVVAPPGATKTEICRAFTGSHVYAVDTLTPQSLLSGFRGKEGQSVDILPDLDGKLLVIKDFTSMLQKPERIRDEVFGRLRAAYDGTLVGAFGSGVKRQARQATFGILAAVTPIIDNYTTVHALLGERFVRVRTHYDRRKSSRSALKHLGKEVEMRREIAEILRIALDFYKMKANAVPRLRADTIERIIALADATAIMRTGVMHDYQNRIIAKPEAEVGTRLSKQFSRLAQALYIMGAYKYSHLIRVAKDTIPKTRLEMALYLKRNGGSFTSDIMKGLKLPRHVVANTGYDLDALEVLSVQEDKQGNYFYLSEDFKQTLEEAGL